MVIIVYLYFIVPESLKVYSFVQTFLGSEHDSSLKFFRNICSSLVAKLVCAEESDNQILEAYFPLFIGKSIGEILCLHQNLWHIGIELALHETLALKIECIIWKPQNKESKKKKLYFSIYLMSAFWLFWSHNTKRKLTALTW